MRYRRHRRRKISQQHDASWCVRVRHDSEKRDSPFHQFRKRVFQCRSGSSHTTGVVLRIWDNVYSSDAAECHVRVRGYLAEGNNKKTPLFLAKEPWPPGVASPREPISEKMLISFTAGLTRLKFLIFRHVKVNWRVYITFGIQFYSLVFDGSEIDL